MLWNWYCFVLYYYQVIGDRKTSKSLITNAPPPGKGLSSNAPLDVLYPRDVLYRKMPRGGPGGGGGEVMGTLVFDWCRLYGGKPAQLGNPSYCNSLCQAHFICSLKNSLGGSVFQCLVEKFSFLSLCPTKISPCFRPQAYMSPSFPMFFVQICSCQDGHRALKVLEKYLKGWEPCSVLPLQNMSCSLVFPPQNKTPWETRDLLF